MKARVTHALPTIWPCRNCSDPNASHRKSAESTTRPTTLDACQIAEREGEPGEVNASWGDEPEPNRDDPVPMDGPVRGDYSGDVEGGQGEAEGALSHDFPQGVSRSSPASQ